jgi:hypothetical protein
MSFRELKQQLCIYNYYLHKFFTINMKLFYFLRKSEIPTQKIYVISFVD